MMQINLLPWREEGRKFKKRRFLVGAIASALVGVLLIILTHIYLAMVAHNQSYLNDFLNNEVNNEQTAVNSTKAQQQEKDNIEASLNQIIALQNQSYDAIRLLNEISLIVPDAIALTHIARQNKNVFLGGTANSDSEVTTFLADIKKSKLFSSAKLNQITSMVDTSDNKRTFEILAVQKEATGD